MIEAASITAFSTAICGEFFMKAVSECVPRFHSRTSYAVRREYCCNVEAACKEQPDQHLAVRHQGRIMPPLTPPKPRCSGG